MRIRWSDLAIAHLEAIHSYIAKNSARYALQMMRRLTGRCKQLREHPRSGQMVPEYDDENLRELIEGCYRIIYKIRGPEVVILAIIHSSQLLPPEPPTPKS